MTQQFIISIGSNVNRVKNIKRAKKWLHEMFRGNITFSRTLVTLPVGVKTAKFHNLIATGNTGLNYEDLERYTKAIELLCNNTKSKRDAHIVEIDIDILKFGDNIFHEKDWDRYYIKELIKDLTEKLTDESTTTL